MASLSPIRPSLVLAPLPNRTRVPISLFQRIPSTHHPFLRGSLVVAKYGFEPGLLPDSATAELVAKDLFAKAESFIYTVADAAVSSSPETVTATKPSSDWLSGITNYLETVLKVLKDGLSASHVPYAYGFAIILLTVLVKAATFPLTKKQVESAMAMRSLQPQIKAIQQRYAGDQERIQLETARLYKLARINPLAGCLPTLATIPVWIGLYRALSNVADEGLLTEGFFWIPSLAGPTTIAAKQNGGGINWLFPFVDGHPPLGWADTVAYLALPVLLVVSQYISVQIMQSTQNNDPNMKSSQALTQFLPLMIGYFALSVPSGLSLYWLTNNILTTAQQVWLQKLGGAKTSVPKVSDEVKEDPLQVQKQAPQMDYSKTEAKKTESSTPQGLRPGERFKQLKEQEARRKLETEEAKKRAEASIGIDVEKSEESQSETPGNGRNAGGSVTNGNLSIPDLFDDQNSSTFTIRNNTLTTTGEVGDRTELTSMVSPPKEK